jgi:catechol 2,3-dioxygenase-like lactoylglutathione lyase family enzyme
LHVAIVGAHVLLYTAEPERLRAVLRDVFGWRHVEDPGSEPGWLIFALPPAELAAHPSSGSTHHKLSLMCDDVESTKADLEAKGVEFRGEPQDMGFGVGVTMVLPGGVELLLYEPRHESPLGI